jgi:hypothetical protein
MARYIVAVGFVLVAVVAVVLSRTWLLRGVQIEIGEVKVQKHRGRRGPRWLT